MKLAISLLTLLLAAPALAGDTKSAPRKSAAKDENTIEEGAASEPLPAAAPANLNAVLETGLNAKDDAALIIANSDYVFLPDVRWGQKDSQLVRDVFRHTLGVPNYRTRVLTEANRWEVLKALQKIRYRPRSGGTLWIYYLGHSDVVGEENKLAILGEDAELTDEGTVRGAIMLDEILDAVTQTSAARTVLILDTAFTGRGCDGEALYDTERPPVSAALPAPRDNLAVWVSARDGTDHESWDRVEHGLFTWTFAGAFRGWADGALGDSPDGTVTLAEAQEYVFQSMRMLGRVQIPTVETRPEVREWLLLKAELEAGPPVEHWNTFFLEDRMARMLAATTKVQTAAQAEWQQVLAQATTGDDAGKQALAEFAARWEHPVQQIAWVPYLPEVDEARKLYFSYGEWQKKDEPEPPAVADTGDTGQPPDTKGPTLEPPKAEPLDDSCDDLIKLEEPAIAGQLRDAQIACLEERMKKEKLQTGKDKISRILLVDAEKKGERERWEQLVLRHLKEIDQSDPDFCFKYAVFLSRQGLERAEDTLWWATRALENKAQWTGEAYIKKVYLLERVRAEAATDLWSAAEEQYLQERTMQAEDNSERHRGKAKMYAREWLEYARLTGQPDQAALEMCLAAAGAMDYCREK